LDGLHRNRESFRDRLEAVELARDSPNKVLVACSRLVYPIRYPIRVPLNDFPAAKPGWVNLNGMGLYYVPRPRVYESSTCMIPVPFFCEMHRKYLRYIAPFGRMSCHPSTGLVLQLMLMAEDAREKLSHNRLNHARLNASELIKRLDLYL